MSTLANTPKPPYYAVIFSSVQTDTTDGYNNTATRMIELAEQQQGYLGIESAREDVGITVSYWQDLESIKAWKQNAEHLEAQRTGHQKWYESFVLRVALVEKEYSKGM